MPDFTVQEKNLMLLACTPGESRRELLATLRQMQAQLPDEDEEYDYLAENKAVEDINRSVRQQIEELKFWKTNNQR